MAPFQGFEILYGRGPGALPQAGIGCPFGTSGRGPGGDVGWACFMWVRAVFRRGLGVGSLPGGGNDDDY